MASVSEPIAYLNIMLRRMLGYDRRDRMRLNRIIANLDALDQRLDAITWQLVDFNTELETIVERIEARRGNPTPTPDRAPETGGMRARKIATDQV